MRKIPVVIASLSALFLIMSCTSPGKPAVPEAPAEAALIPVPAPQVIEAPVPEPKVDTITDILAQVFIRLEAGDYDGALALFDLITGEDAESSRILLLKASILCSAGRFSEARDITDVVRVREPENTEALLVLASLEGAAGREKEQKAALEKIIKIDPEHVPALIGLGNIAVRGEKRSVTLAATYFDQALGLEPENLEALLGRAGVYRYAHDPQHAEELLNRTIKLYPQEAEPWGERSRLYRSAGFLIQALSDIDKAKELNGQDYWISLDRGMTLVDLNRKALALEEFTYAQNLNPDHFLSYVYTAGIKDETGDYGSAEHDYEILVKLRPDYYYAQEGLGMLKMRNHQWEAARNAFIQAYNSAPTEWSYAILAMINWRRLTQPGNIRDFANMALKKLSRDSLEYAMLRLFLDMNGDDGVSRRVSQEQDPKLKARMLYYLSCYYDIQGKNRIADAMLGEIMGLENRTAIPEWRLVMWAMEERSLAALNAGE
jgi:tetratricopeptide (TPR) repeat protein